ncbi:MAG TPA: DUF3768 domain-containing protein [Aestuariivirga sp.]|nr:DUF3768 domain-containing protein [Aestuariivirga sp.]
MTTDDKYCPNFTSLSSIDYKISLVENLARHNKLSAISELNDRLRKNGKGGMWLATASISSLPPHDLRQVLEAVIGFDDFNADNDPHGEHDCATQSVGNLKIIWKIDYYDRAREFLSPDPSDPKVTLRVLTVMLASEY